MNRRRVVLAVAMLVVALVLASCGGGSGPDANKEERVTPPTNLVMDGKLTYGTAATFPPFEYRDSNGNLTGFDIEMVAKLAEYMGLEVEFLDMDFDGLIPALKGGRIDIINSAMYIKPEREEQVDFVPYLVIGEAIIVPKGNPQNIGTLDDLCGKTVAVTRGAIGEVYMTKQNEQCKEKNLPDMTILALPTNQDAMLAVAQGQAAAFDTSIPGAAHLLQQRPDEFEVATTFDLGTRIGIAVRKGDTEMRRAIEEAMRLFVEEGHYEKLLEKYNLPPESNLFKSQ